MAHVAKWTFVLATLASVVAARGYAAELKSRRWVTTMAPW